jgi:hypothetical protein
MLGTRGYPWVCSCDLKNVTLLTRLGLISRKYYSPFCYPTLFRYYHSFGTYNPESCHIIMYQYLGLHHYCHIKERLYARRKIQSLCLQNGMSNIWFTINPNDLTNEINMKLTAFRGQNDKEAEKLFRMLQQHIKSIQHTVRDPVSASVFFHREISLFFEKYVRTGENSVFGKVSCYFACVETNERGLFISMAFCGLMPTSTCQTCWRTRRSPRTRAIGS